MNSLLLLIPLGLGLLAIALGFFLWAVRNGQLENLDHEGSRILFDDDTPSARPHGLEPQSVESRSAEPESVEPKSTEPPRSEP